MQAAQHHALCQPASRPAGCPAVCPRAAGRQLPWLRRRAQRVVASSTKPAQQQHHGPPPAYAVAAAPDTPRRGDGPAAAGAPHPGHQLLGSFQWTSHWWPVAVAATTDAARPHAVELLGRQLVLWRDSSAGADGGAGDGQWHCMEDACPHRLAPLSQGRIEADGTLQCSYHGWRFAGDGRATEIPQALDAKAKAVACSSSRSCVASYPVCEAYGLVWVWPTAGPAAAAEAAAAPLPVSKGLQELWAARDGGHHRWYRRELPYSYDMLIENLADPSHLPFSHHRLTPNMLRNKASPMPFAQLDVPAGDSPADAAARPTYSFAHAAPLAAFSFPSVLSPGGRVAFNAPGCVVYQYDLGPYMMQNDLLAVPLGPGRSMAYTLGFSNTPQVTNTQIVQALFTNPKQAFTLMLRASFQRRPLYQEHLGMNLLFDQDNVFLNMQDRLLAARGKSAWAKDYYMPAPCDGLVVAVRRWADEAYKLKLPHTYGGGGSSSGNGGGSSGNAGGGSSNGGAAPGSEAQAGAPAAGTVLSLSAAAAAAPRLPPRQLNDRFHQHTQHCTECSAALRRFKARLQAAQAAAAACLAGLAGLLGAAVLPRVAAALVASQQQAATAAAAAAAAAVGASWGQTAAVAALLGAAGLLAAAVAASTAKLIARFEYVEFAHADNH